MAKGHRTGRAPPWQEGFRVLPDEGDGASAGSVPALIGIGALGLAWTILFALYGLEN